jgi:hypothetical protein
VGCVVGEGQRESLVTLATSSSNPPRDRKSAPFSASSPQHRSTLAFIMAVADTSQRSCQALAVGASQRSPSTFSSTDRMAWDGGGRREVVGGGVNARSHYGRVNAFPERNLFDVGIAMEMRRV